MDEIPDTPGNHGTAKRVRRLGITPTLLRIALGALVAGIGLEAFLVPNHIIDGGVTGVSIMAAQLSGLPLGLFLVLLNVPFLLFGYKRLGRRFAFGSFFGVSALALVTVAFPHIEPITHVPILAATFGGAAVGIGVGSVIRAGGCLDGTEIIGILADRRSMFSVGEIIMGINLFILTSAGFIFGWDNALYSLIAYFVAYKAIDTTVLGLDESKSAWIVSDMSHAIGAAIERELGREVTYLSGKSEPEGDATTIVYAVITRVEETRLKAIVRRYDPRAFMTIGRLHEVLGKSYIDG